MEKVYKIIYCISIFLFLNGCKENINEPNAKNELEGKWSTTFPYSGIRIGLALQTTQTAVDTFLSILSFDKNNYSLNISKLDGSNSYSNKGEYYISKDTLKLMDLKARYIFNIKQDTLKIQHVVIFPPDSIITLYNGMYDFAIIRNYVKLDK